jgi:hypothetical protein
VADNLTPGQTPGYGSVSGARETGAYSGTKTGGLDPTLEPGNYSSSIFGVQLPAGTGAPGSQGAAYSGDVDPTNQPGQLNEGISGEGPAQTANTGAPGSQGATNGGAGPDAVSFTRPGSYLSGTYQQDTVHDSISGPSDWTQAIDGSYAGGGPQLPGIKGNEPTSTGAGAGRVLRGGRAAG